MTSLQALKHQIGTWMGRPRRWDYLTNLPKGGVGAELGVFRGEFTPHILRITKPRELHLIDGWWELYGDHFPDWGTYTDHGQLSTRQAYDEAKRRTAGAAVVFHVGNDLDILPTFADGFFDWVYLDSSHQYDHTMRELEILQHKVAQTIMGDDWRLDPNADDANAGCARAVRDFCEGHGWRLVEPDRIFLQWAIVRS